MIARTPSRDALAKALWMTTTPSRMNPRQAEGVWGALSDDLIPKRSYIEQADRLLDSGAVIDAAALAEPLCKRLCDMAGEPRLFIPGEISAALAAALIDAEVSA